METEMETGATQVGARSKGWRVRLGLVAAVLASTVPVAVATTATPAQAAISERHFVKITTTLPGAAWTAWGWLLNPKGQQIYAWKEIHSNGRGYALWRWTWKGDSSWLRVKIDVATGADVDKSHLKLDRDHCFFVLGSLGAGYTGDSKTATCKD